jgi:hypothetical protein
MPFWHDALDISDHIVKIKMFIVHTMDEYTLRYRQSSSPCCEVIVTLPF